MENDNKKESSEGGFKNTLLTIISVFVYIIYKLVKGSFSLIKSLWKCGIVRGIVSAVGIVILFVVAAIFFWPVMIMVITAIVLWAFFHFCLNSF